MNRQAEENASSPKIDWSKSPPRFLRGEAVILISKPPTGYYKIVNLYAQKINGTYQPVIEIDTEAII